MNGNVDEVVNVKSDDRNIDFVSVVVDGLFDD